MNERSETKITKQKYAKSFLTNKRVQILNYF